MTYKELSRVTELLKINGYMKQKQVIWDIDMYQILNTVNKDMETCERSK